MASGHEKYMKIESLFCCFVMNSLKEKKNKKEKQKKVIQMNQFSVALVGRTNVGKSTLFNRLVGRKDAIVSRMEGTTRDRREGKGTISGLEFTLIDTGGYVVNYKGITEYSLMQFIHHRIEKLINKQTEYAVEKADVVLFVVDGKAGLTNEDRSIAAFIFDFKYDCRWLRSKRNMKELPIYTVVNKTEGLMTHTNEDGISEEWEDLKNEMYSLGFGEAIGMSAEHGDGLIDLFTLLSPYGQLLNLKNKEDREKYDAFLKEQESLNKKGQSYEVHTNVDPVKLQLHGYVQEEKDRDDEILQLTILGIPNSGKSTLLNTLVQSDRFITGNIPGLTRDTVSCEVEYKGRRIRLVDTPGIPKADGVLPPSLNSLSIYHAHKQIQYSHVVALILDGSRILTKHDLALAKEVGQ